MTELIQNREDFLKNLTEKLGIERQPVESHPFEPMNQLPHETLSGKTQDELLQVAKERVKKIHTNIVETKQADLEGIINELIGKWGNGKVLLPTDNRFKEVGLNQFDADEYADHSVDFDRAFWQKGANYREENIQTASEANVAVAFAEFLLAESGSIVVETHAGQGRSLHFLPTHYISIVPKSKIVPRSTQAADFYHEKRAKGETLGSAIHFISGPSNSGDIEMQLVVGLHGPIEVVYVVVEDL